MPVMLTVTPSSVHHVPSLPLTSLVTLVHAPVTLELCTAQAGRAHAHREDAIIGMDAPTSPHWTPSSLVTVTSPPSTSCATSSATMPCNSQTPPFPLQDPVAVVIDVDDHDRTAGRLRPATVFDHRILCTGIRDAPTDLQNPAMPSPTPLNDQSTMTTVVIRDAPQHPVEPI